MKEEILFVTIKNGEIDDARRLIIELNTTLHSHRKDFKKVMTDIDTVLASIAEHNKTNITCWAEVDKERFKHPKWQL